MLEAGEVHLLEKFDPGRVLLKIHSCFRISFSQSKQQYDRWHAVKPNERSLPIRLGK